MVGYNHKDLLYAAIQADHARATGRPLAKLPSFGGHSGLIVEWGKMHYVPGCTSQDESAAEHSRKTLGVIALTLGRKIFGETSEGIFASLLRAAKPNLQRQRPAEHLKIRLTDDAAIMRITEAIEVAMSSGRRSGHAESGDAAKIMRDADAAQRMHEVRRKASVLLEEHRHYTRLTRAALQVAGAFDAVWLEVADLQPEQLQHLINYLKDDARLREAITASVQYEVGGASSPRYGIICADPDAQIALVLQGAQLLRYDGDEFEQALRLVPLGYAMVVVAMDQFQESVNNDTTIAIDSLATLRFTDDDARLVIGPAYGAISAFMADTERSGASFNTTREFQYIARAMRDSIDAARDAGEWRSLCRRTLQVNKEYPDSKASMPKSVLAATVQELHDMMHSEADLSDLLSASFDNCKARGPADHPTGGRTQRCRRCRTDT